MRDSYKRFVKTWIRFANPWIRTVSWITNPDFKRFVSNRDHESIQFPKDSTCFHESYESLRILSTIAQNESLKIKIRKSESLRIFKVRIRKSGFVNLNPMDSFLKDLFCVFVSCKQKSQITRFISICKDSYTNPASLIITL